MYLRNLLPDFGVALLVHLSRNEICLSVNVSLIFELLFNSVSVLVVSFHEVLDQQTHKTRTHSQVLVNSMVLGHMHLRSYVANKRYVLVDCLLCNRINF